MVFSKKMMGRALALGLAACMSLSGMVTYASQTATTQINSTLPKYVFYFYRGRPWLCAKTSC